MTALAESTKRELSLLQLAEELNNVSKAGQIMGYHRDTFYEVRRAFPVGGVGALVAQRRGPRQPHPNRVSAEVEEADPRLLPRAPDLGCVACGQRTATVGAERVTHRRARGMAAP